MITASRLYLGLVLASVVGMPFSTAAAALVPSSIMDVTAINAVGDGQNPGDGVVTGLQTNVGLIDASSLIGVTLTGFSDDTQVTALTERGLASFPSPNRSVVEDLNVDSALANYATMSFDFNAPVVNRPGAEIFIVDIGRDTDEFSATIAGVTKDYAVNEDKGSSTDERFFQVWTSTVLGSNYSSVAELDAAAFSAGNNAQSGRRVTLIDLSDFGLANGDSTTAISLASTDGHDIALVAGLNFVIPEPASATLFSLLAGLGVACSGRLRPERG